jgi:hypothetical protein
MGAEILLLLPGPRPSLLQLGGRLGREATEKNSGILGEERDSRNDLKLERQGSETRQGAKNS